MATSEIAIATREACGQLRAVNQGLSSFRLLLTYYTILTVPTYYYPGGGGFPVPGTIVQGTGVQWYRVNGTKAQ